MKLVHRALLDNQVLVRMVTEEIQDQMELMEQEEEMDSMVPQV